MYLLRFWSSQRIDDGKRVAVFFFSFLQLHNNRQRLFFIWTFSALTKQFIPFEIALLFSFRHVFSHIIHGKMICKMWIQMRTHTHTRNPQMHQNRIETKKKTKTQMESVRSICRRCIFFLRFHLSRWHILLFTFQHSPTTWPDVYIRSNAILFALIRVWNYLWKCDEMCNAQR